MGAEEKDEVKSNLVNVPISHWEDLASTDLTSVCRRSLATLGKDSHIAVRFLNMDLVVDLEKRKIGHMRHHHWHDLDNSLLELMTLVYLLNARNESPVEDLISVNGLKDALFFQGAHDLPTSPLIERFGYDLERFKAASSRIEGVPVEHGDAAFRFSAFPKIPLHYILWEGDEEFEPNFSILFDRSIEKHLAADAILGTVNLVTGALLNAGKQ